MIFFRESQIQVKCVALFRPDQSLFKSLDKAVGADHQVIAACSAVKLHTVQLSDIVDADGISFFDLAVHFLKGSIGPQSILNIFIHILICDLCRLFRLNFQMFV